MTAAPRASPRAVAMRQSYKTSSVEYLFESSDHPIPQITVFMRFTGILQGRRTTKETVFYRLDQFENQLLLHLMFSIFTIEWSSLFVKYLLHAIAPKLLASYVLI